MGFLLLSFSGASRSMYTVISFRVVNVLSLSRHIGPYESEFAVAAVPVSAGDESALFAQLCSTVTCGLLTER